MKKVYEGFKLPDNLKVGDKVEIINEYGESKYVGIVEEINILDDKISLCCELTIGHMYFYFDKNAPEFNLKEAKEKIEKNQITFNVTYKIDKCSQCPFYDFSEFWNDDGGEYFCERMNHKKIGDSYDGKPFVIPEWCPMRKNKDIEINSIKW